MRRTAVSAALAALAAAAPCTARAAALPPAQTGAAAPAPAPPAAPLPPDLLALEQKLAQLKLTSLRFTLVTKVVEAHPSRETAQLLALFGLNGKISGEETLEPPAAIVTLGFFSQQLTFRIVGSSVYVYFSGLARADGGRPWIRLGASGLAELLGAEGGGRKRGTRAPAVTPTLGQPSYAQAPFTKLTGDLAGASAVRELGPAVVEGQPVTRFLATLRPAQLGLPSAAVPSRRRHRRGVRTLPRPPQPRVTLEVAFAGNGMPVQLTLSEALAGFTTIATVEFPEINFPLAITAPAPAETISVREFRALVAKAKKRGAPAHRRHRG